MKRAVTCKFDITVPCYKSFSGSILPWGQSSESELFLSYLAPSRQHPLQLLATLSTDSSASRISQSFVPLLFPQPLLSCKAWLLGEDLTSPQSELIPLTSMAPLRFAFPSSSSVQTAMFTGSHCELEPRVPRNGWEPSLGMNLLLCLSLALLS